MTSAVRWCASLDDYLSALEPSSLISGLVPVITPPDGRRRARWAAMLAGRVRFPATARSTRHLVVALDDDLAALARAYAALDGRRFVRVEPDQLDRGCDDCESVLVMGWPRQFSSELVHRLSSSLTMPWGLVVARDVPGLTFSIAKLLLRSETVTSVGCAVDAIAGTATIHAGGRSEPAEFATVPALLSQTWNMLALRAHGRLGHVNLGGAVLCPLVGEAEVDWEGTPRFGCHGDEDVACKRVPARDRPVFRYRDLRAECLLVYSCSSAPMAGDLYPTDSSVALAVAEGPATACVVTNTLFKTTGWEAGTALSWATAGADIGTIVRLQNDVYERFDGQRPFMLLGDPAPRGDRAPAPTPPPFRDAPYTMLPLASPLAAARVVGPEPNTVRRQQPKYWRVADDAVVVDRPGQDHLRFADWTGTLAEARRWFSQVAQRSAAARHLEATIEVAHGRRIEASADLTRSHSDVLRAHALVDRALSRAASAMHLTLLEGLWRGEIEQIRAWCVACMGLWDHALLSLLRCMLDEQELSAALTSGCLLARRESSVACDRCGYRLVREEWTGLQDETRLLVARCPTCGERTWATAPGVSGDIACSSRVSPGESLHVELSTRHESSLTANDTWFLCRLWDNVKRQSVRVADRSCRDGRLSVAIDVPADLAASCHHLAALSVKDMAVSGAAREIVNIRTSY